MNDPSPVTDPLPPSSNGSGHGHGHGPGPQKPPPLPELPPVEAPSAAFIVQLFVIPAVVVFVVILVWLLFGKLAGGERDAMEYVRLIRASANNPRAANRAAYELASLIQNDPRLASDRRLVGELTDLLDHDLDRVPLENPEMTQYVALALGRFQTLEGASAAGQAIDPVEALERALDAKYPDKVQIAAAASLATHAARLKGKLDAPKAVEALAAAGKAGEPALREMAAFALGFIDGPGAAAALRDRLKDESRYVRYNAAVALARRDDPEARATVREMLSPGDLDKVIDLDSEAEKRSKIEAIELEALNALQTAAQDGRTDLARALRPEVEALTRSGLAGVRTNAQAVLKLLPERP